MNNKKKVLASQPIAINFGIKIHTPTHIGGAQEKHGVKNLDFVITNRQLSLINDRDKLLSFVYHNNSDALANDLINNSANLENKIRQNLDILSDYQFPFHGDTEELKRNIKYGVNERSIGIPGSSLKGAIVSRILNLHTTELNFRKSQVPEKDIFGKKIENKITRHLQVGDVMFDEMTIINSKIYNLSHPINSRDWEGCWKNGKNERRFDKSRFTTAYECIKVGALSKCRIVLNRAQLNTDTKSPSRWNDFWGGPIGDDHSEATKERIIRAFFSNIQKQTQDYLQKELDFFEKYKEAEYAEEIIQTFKQLYEVSKTKILLRLGQGSGFHSITGDWRCKDHLQSIIKPIRDKKNRNIYWKSRKIGFQPSDTNEIGIEFFPLGFIELLPIEQYAAALSEKADLRKKQEQQRIAAIEKAKEAAAQKEAARLEAIRPKMIDISELKINKEKEVDAKVVGKEGKSILFNVFVKGFETKIFKLRYPVGMANDTIIRVTVRKTKKGIECQGQPKIKK